MLQKIRFGREGKEEGGGAEGERRRSVQIRVWPFVPDLVNSDFRFLFSSKNEMWEIEKHEKHWKNKETTQ